MAQLLEFTGNHPYLVGGVLIAWAAVMIYEIRLRSQGLSHVSTTESVRLINKGAVVLDVRNPEEYSSGHIVNARNVPLEEIETGGKTLNKLRKKVVLTVCNTGQSSGKAAGLLRKAGFEQVFSIRGGLAAWRKDNMPIAK
jgi:rhodanese-related sulfurtransferase